MAVHDLRDVEPFRAGRLLGDGGSSRCPRPRPGMPTWRRCNVHFAGSSELRWEEQSAGDQEHA